MSFSFFFFTSMCGWHCCHCHFNLASLSGEWDWGPLGHFLTFICSNQHCYLSSLSAYPRQCCSFNMRKRASLRARCRTVLFYYFCHKTWSGGLDAFVSKGRQVWGRFLKKVAQGTQQEAGGWCLFTKSVSMFDDLIISIHSAFCLQFTLLHCNQISFFHKLQAMLLKIWIIFLWFLLVIQSCVEALFAFPLQKCSFHGQPKNDKTKYESLLVCSRAM